MIRICRACLPLLILLGVLASCVPPEVPVAPTLKLLAWEGEVMSLFDDGIDLAALGYTLDGQRAADDPALPRQTRHAELVTRVTVATLSRDGNGEHSSYVLTVRVDPNAFVSRSYAVESLEFTIPDSSPTYELIDSNENSVRGRSFIAFLRRFAGIDGPVVHWHLRADAEDVAKAVVVAAATEALNDG